MLEFHSRHMNTNISISGLNAPDASRVFKWMSSLEHQFSRFLPCSELSHVNRSVGNITHVSRQFAELLYEALRFYQETDGIFNPFLGNIMRKIGYDRSFEQMDKRNAHREPLPLTADQTTFTFDLEQCSITLPCGSALDFGGIAKGWAVQKAAVNLIGQGRPYGLINAGGDLMCWNGATPTEPWVINVTHPYSDDQTIGKLIFHSGQWGAATSSKIKRSWSDGRHRFHHLIDPRTALPSESDIIQATVIGPALLPCEIYAKCLMIMGSREGSKWLEARHPDLAYLFIDKDGHVIVSSNLKNLCSYKNFPGKISFPPNKER
ncbi:FAD:protein FMN transferase [Sporolactobacillus nakayamae]|uniref:FAD:protein FMN transferase n=1 Tax=Sporolactobacillus nakayamae TaxID=269670 RepID=A0A1I2QMQ8_9BACL|nr:FAD:protein FMN transferase [Sporolactobacillus nakayamae]SFG28933.1 thiamine biosynthesis lipoprotein [Sporolactobacillus nakayamae]